MYTEKFMYHEIDEFAQKHMWNWMALRSRGGTQPTILEAPRTPSQPIPHMGNYHTDFYHHRHVICLCNLWKWNPISFDVWLFYLFSEILTLSAVEFQVVYALLGSVP